MEAGLRQWQASVEQFALGRLPAPGAQVVEIGCGQGELALALSRAGYRVTAVDPEAPDGPIFRRMRFEELDAGAASCDAVVAVLSLHHVDDVGTLLDKAVRLLRPDGRLLVVEFAWDRIDEATARWYCSHLPATGDQQEHGFLRSCCRQWAGQRSAAEPRPFEALRDEWASREGLHDSSTMLGELRARCAATLLRWGPYLHRDLGVSEAAEAAAIEAGKIRATSFRFVGRRRAGR